MSRDLTKLETAKLLRRLKACDEARKWARGKTLRRAWAACERGDWLEWLADALGVQMTSEARRAYDAVMAEARRAYAAARAEADRAYDAAWRAYDEAMDAAWRAYNEAKDAAWRAYNEAKDAAGRAAIPYEQIRDAARAFLGGGRWR